MNRREAIKTGACGAAAAAIPTAALVSAATPASTVHPFPLQHQRLGSGLASLSADEWLDGEVAELICFRKSLDKLRGAAIGDVCLADGNFVVQEATKSLTFNQWQFGSDRRATCKVWTTREMFGIREPEIPHLHWMMSVPGSGGRPSGLHMACARLAKVLQLIPNTIRVVEEFPPYVPNEGAPYVNKRVDSRHYFVDTEEATFGPRATAMILTDMVDEIWDAWASFTRKATHPYLVKPMGIYLSRDTSVATMRAWSTGNLFTTNEDPLWGRKD